MRLRWSSPTLFNDPFDMQFDLHIKFDLESLKKKVLEGLWRLHYEDAEPDPNNILGLLVAAFRGPFPKLTREQFEAEFGPTVDASAAKILELLPSEQDRARRVLADIKLLCLAETPDNILMWSHYSDQHRGAVIEVCCRPEFDSAWGAAMPVRYCVDMPLLMDEDELAAFGSGQFSLSPHEIFRRIVYSKAIDWAYEREWRIVGGRGEPEPYADYQFQPTEVSAVYMGCMTAEDDARDIELLLQAGFPHAKLYRARKNEKSFHLDFVRTR